MSEYWPRYKAKPARAVAGGIRAQKTHGSFSGTWWGKRWIATLEGFQIGARLSRGKSYARKGQVADLHIEPGEVTARVQGTRRTPYHISIRLKAWSPEQQSALCERLRRTPLLTAQLLGNEMPDDIDAVFQALALPLFPEAHRDFSTDCSCPDWSNPCKHIAAVHYLLAEAFDSDPFLLFALRGMGRDALLAALRPAGAAPLEEADDEQAEPIPLPLDRDLFWAGSEVQTQEESGEEGPRPPAALPKRLGPFPFWRSEQPFFSTLEIFYANASELARSCLVDEE